MAEKQQNRERIIHELVQKSDALFTARNELELHIHEVRGTSEQSQNENAAANRQQYRVLKDRVKAQEAIQQALIDELSQS